MANEILGDTGGKWGTVSFAIPDFLQEVRDAINDFAELLITFLEIANLALEFVKAFIKAFLDPLVAIIEAIIAAILEFLRSLKGIGLYITGDWALLGWPPEDLRGGFQGFERRMIARLTDRTDPTRPDVPSTTEVLGFFTYLSVDPTDFERLLNFIITLMKLFGLSFSPDSSSLPVPTIRAIKYGSGALGVDTAFQFKPLANALSSFNGAPPQTCRVTWVTQPASQKHPLNPFPMLGPSGYLVTVSTIPEGIPLKFARPRSNTDQKPAGGIPGAQVQPREYGDVTDVQGRSVSLYGGAEMLVFKGTDYEFNKGLSDGVLKPNYCQVFGLVGKEIIPLEQLGPHTPGVGIPGDGKGSDYLLQRTFLITDGVTLAQWFAGEYGAMFNLNDMPLHAKWRKDDLGQVTVIEGSAARASTYYFRVWSVGKQVAEEAAYPKWDFKQVAYNGATAGQPFRVDLQSGRSSISSPSTARKATFVGVDTQEYLKALQTALLILVLTRTDLPTLDELVAAKGTEAADKYRTGEWAGQGFALAPTGLEDARGLLQRMYPDLKTLEVPGQDPLQWRSDLYNRIRVLTEELYAKSGTNARVERFVVDSTEMLRTYTVGAFLSANAGVVGSGWVALLKAAGLPEDCTLLEAFDPNNKISRSLEVGFAPNMNSTGLKPTDVDELAFVQGVFSGQEQYATYQGGEFTLVFEEPDPVKVVTLLTGLPEGLRRIYTKFVQADGSLHVPDEYREYLTAVRGDTAPQRVSTSGDLTPVCVVGRSLLEGLNRDATIDNLLVSSGGIVYQAGLVFGRGLTYETALCVQAALVLRVATSERAPGDGEWIAIRLFDTWPELEEFLRKIENWVKALAEAVKSIAEAIIKYIEFVQAQIVELQQLIRRINALIQSFLSFSFALPQFSGLMLQSQGTDGILADFVAAKNKPSDSPLSYGAGIAVVAPFAPGFILDIIAVATADDDNTPSTQDLNGTTTTTRPPDAVGTEGVEPAPGPPPSDEPDVL